MPVRYYVDHHVPRAITVGLRMRGIDVITAYEDDCAQLDDPALLERATSMGRTLFSRDDDLLAVAVQRQRDGEAFRGLVYAHQLRVSIGTCIDDLETIARAAEEDDVVGQILFLPL